MKQFKVGVCVSFSWVSQRPCLNRRSNSIIGPLCDEQAKEAFPPLFSFMLDVIQPGLPYTTSTHWHLSHGLFTLLLVKESELLFPITRVERIPTIVRIARVSAFCVRAVRFVPTSMRALALARFTT